jgi:hypothetical protein
MGSEGFLEIAIAGSSARSEPRLGVGAIVRIEGRK